jgi:hypothetical protein
MRLDWRPHVNKRSLDNSVAMPETPEQRARREIDADLTAAGWFVQNRDEIDLTAGRGIAVSKSAFKTKLLSWQCHQKPLS